jgi:NADPH:quinone reductase-like Zn-dependent oxidoreductase
MTYQRVILSTTGAPDVLQLIEEERTPPGAGHARVRVLTAGVSFADIACRLGKYPTAPKVPFTPGYDIVGVVEEVGNGVSAIQSGQTVAAVLPHFGGYTQVIHIPASLLVPVPDDIDPAAAVTIPLNYLTAHGLLHRCAGVQPGERVLVHSAAGGIGTAVLELGKRTGLELYGTASKRKRSVITALGGVPIDYQNEDFVTRIRDLTNGEGVDVVLDAVGGRVFRRSYGVLRRGGRLVSFGYISAAKHGSLAFVGTMLPLFAYKLIPDGKRTRFYGSTPPMAASHPEWYHASMSELLGLLAGEQIAPVIGERLPLAEAARAHTLLENGQTHGKIVLVCNES